MYYKRVMLQIRVLIVYFRFSIVNMYKSESLFTAGMKPLLYSTKDASQKNVGWRRCGESIAYYKNDAP